MFLWKRCLWCTCRAMEGNNQEVLKKFCEDGTCVLNFVFCQEEGINKILPSARFSVLTFDRDFWGGDKTKRFLHNGTEVISLPYYLKHGERYSPLSFGSSSSRLIESHSCRSSRHTGAIWSFHSHLFFFWQASQTNTQISDSNILMRLHFLISAELEIVIITTVMTHRLQEWRFSNYLFHLMLMIKCIYYPNGSFFSLQLRHKHKVFACNDEHDLINLNERLYFHRHKRGIMTIIQMTPSVGLVKYSGGRQLISASLFSSNLSVRREL